MIFIYETHTLKYDEVKNQRAMEGEFLRALRAAVKPFVTHADYLPIFKKTFKLMHDHRTLFENHYYAEEEFKEMEKRHKQAMKEADEKMALATAIEETRKSQRVQAQLSGEVGSARGSASKGQASSARRN